jgi:Domain of unknown function (DUF4129)
MNPGFLSNLVRNVKVFRFLGYLLVFLMMACAVMTVGMLIQNVSPRWHSGIIAGILSFIVIDRLYTFRQLRSLTPLSSEWVVAISGQWLLILLLMRFLLAYADGLDALRADLSLFGRGYIGELFTPEFVVSFLLALLAWYLSGRFLDLLEEIGLDPVLAMNDSSIPIGESVPAHQRLVGLIFSLGIGLVILTALARVDMQTIASSGEGLPRIEFNRLSGAEAGALLYFVFGLALLSLSRLMSLQTHWNRLRIPVSSKNLARQWGLYSLLFLLILAILVSVLPAGDTFGFFSVLGSLLNFLASVLFFLGQLILTLILLLISLPFALLGRAPPALRLPAPPPLPVMPPVESEAPTSSAVWALVRSVLLWGSLVLIVVFALVQFVRGHGGLGAALRRSRLTTWLVMAWQWLSGNVNNTRESLARAIADGWQSILSRLEGNRMLSPVSLIRLRSLDPRRQIYFFYLAMIRRGAEQGLPRKPSQTPSEYAVTLDKTLPDAGEDIHSMTQAFVEARYSRREVNSSDAATVKAIWGRIRRALQSKAKDK